MKAVNSILALNRITMAYTRATCHNPKDSIAENMDQAFGECPEVVLALDSYNEIFAELNNALAIIEITASRFRDKDLMRGNPWPEAAAGYDQNAARIRAALAKAEGSK